MRGSQSAAWYDEDGDVHKTLIRVVTNIRNHSGWRRSADDFHVELYAGTSGASGLTSGMAGEFSYGSATLPNNVCRMAVDTLTAKIAKHRPLPQVLASRSNWAQQKRAKKMTQFIEGEFYRQRVFERHAKSIVRDAGTFGRGLLKVFQDGKRICCERAEPREIVVDEWDARYGDPRNLYQVRTVDRGVLTKQFRSKASDIEGAVGKDIDITRSGAHDTMSTVERVDVVEAWHLCDDEAAHEAKEDHKCTGRHVIAVHGATLVDEPWSLPYFPFAVLRYNEPISGWYGQGLVEQLEGYQYQLNLTNERLAEMFRMSGVLVWTPLGGNIVESEVRNGIGTFIRSSAPPQVLQIDLVNEHARARPAELTQGALNESGLSQMSVQSQKPAGISSGVALQTLDDIETERFIVFGRSYESWCLEVARMFIDIVKSIADEHGEYAVRVPMRGGILDLKWADAEVDGYELRVFSTSLLPQQPAARLEKLMQLFNTGVWGREVFLREFESLDIQAEMDLEIADQINTDERLESMLEADPENDAEESLQKPPRVYRPPTSYQNYTWAARRAQQKLNKAETDGAPAWNLEMLRAFILDCEWLRKRENADAASASSSGDVAAQAPLAGSPAVPDAGAASPMPPMPGMAA